MRHTAWRLGRRLYAWARGDTTNDPQRNGEYWLLDAMLGPEKPRVLIDIGANVGNWTRTANAIAEARRLAPPNIIAFEPLTPTREILESNLAGCDNVEIVPLALSSRAGAADFYYDAAGAGTNSLSPTSGSKSERVEVTTLDTFVAQRGIRDIGMVKIDTEGFDFGVLEGFKQALANGLAEVVQFEYNWRWLLTRSSLHDVFELIKGTPYVLGKLERESMAFFAEWHFELDRYFENNYVLIRHDSPLRQLGRTARFNESNVEVMDARER